MIENLDIFDCNYKFIGKTDLIMAHKLGLWHQGFHCWMYNIERNVLLIQMRKKHNGKNFLDISSAGHLTSGEKPIDGIREIKEELGIDIDINKLVYAGYFKEAIDGFIKDNVPFFNREFCHTYFYQYNESLNDFKIQEDELDGIYEIKLDNLHNLFSNKIKNLEINGLFNNKKDSRIITENDFMPRGNNLWLKALKIIQSLKNNDIEVYI